MSELIENKCQNCSATIKFDCELEIMKCPYCESEFRVSMFSIGKEEKEIVAPLVIAASKGKIEKVKELLAGGMGVNAKDGEAIRL